MDEQGMLSVDLLFATFILVIIIGSTAMLISDRVDTVDESQRLVEARALAENVAGAIDQVYAGGEGQAIKIKMPQMLNEDTNYRIRVNSSGVLVTTINRRGLAYVLPKKFSSNPKNLQSVTIIMYPSKEYTITNRRGANGDNWIVIE